MSFCLLHIETHFRARLISPLFLIIFLCSGLAYAAQEEKPGTDEVEAVADNLQYLKTERKLVGDGNVVVSYRDIELTADHAEIEVDTKKAHATGHVVVRQKLGGTLSGDEVFFNFKDSSGRLPDGRFFHFPWYGRGEELKQINKNKIVAQNAFITSCDLPHPHYDVKAKQADIYPGDKIVAKNVVFRILEVPVFWWPYLIIPLDHNSPVDITPGYSDERGAFVLVSKGIALNRNVHGRAHVDWYSKRGVGYGLDLEYKFEQLGLGQVKLYGIKDKRAPNQRATNPFADDSEHGAYRGRASWKHRMRIDPLTTLQLQWHELSDDRFLQDFFEREYREEIDPQSFITVTRNADQYSLLTHIEKRTNRFQNVGEKLPEVVFTWLRKPLFGTNFYYTNEEGFVNFKQTKAFSPKGPSTYQFYTDQEFSYPLHFFRFYNFIPFVNFREDYFTETLRKEQGVGRFIGGMGFDSSTRFYRTWNYEGNFFGIKLNQIRHVFEPIIQYNSVKIANQRATDLIETGRGGSLDLQDILTFGMENRIQTKRKTRSGAVQRVDLVSFNAFIDYSFGPGSNLLKTRENRFTEARAATILRPYDWLAFRMDTIYDMVDYEFQTNNLDLVLDPGRLHLALSHRYDKSRGFTNDTINGIVNQNTLIDKSELTIDAYYRLNARWTVGGYVRWGATKNIFEEWELRATRDLHDWLLDFGYNVRNSDRTEASKQLNKEVFVKLSLKALPGIELKTGHRASFSDSRISNTVTGSNEAPTPPPFTISPDAQYASLSPS